MICVYDRYERNFDTNGLGILDKDIRDDIVFEELNGIFKFTGTYPLNGRLSAFIYTGATLRVSTPEGDQPFRIWSVVKLNEDLFITAYHISFDLNFKFIEDKNLVNLGSQAALGRLTENTGFTAISDVTRTASARVVRKTVQAAIFDSGTDNSFVNRWGGEFVRDKFTINAKNRRGRTYATNPVSIRYGKNLVSYETTIDESTYYNRIMPIAFNGLLLPEKYVDRTGIDLNDIRIKLVECGDIKAIQDANNPQEDEVPLETAYQMMRDRITQGFTNGLYDPKVNHRVEFVELSTTVEYANKAVLETLYLGDEVKIVNSEGIDVIARVISYEWNPKTKTFKNIELGNFQEKPMSIISKLDILTKTVDEVKSVKQLTEEHVTSLLTSALGGYVKTINGEMFIMDTEDPLTATKVWRWNINGLGYSSTGVNGPYTTAITMDGNIVGSFIQANSITVNQLSSDVGQSLDLSSNIAVTSKVSQVDYDEVEKRVTSTEQKIAPDEIINTVTQSNKYTGDISGIKDDIANLETNLTNKFTTDIDGFRNEYASTITNLEGKITDYSSYFDWDAPNTTLKIGASNAPTALYAMPNGIAVKDGSQTIVEFIAGQMLTDDAVVKGSLYFGNHKAEKYGSEITLLLWTGGKY